MQSMRRLQSAGELIFITLGFIILQNYLNKWIYQFAFYLYPIYQSFDPDNAFIYLYIHHIIQAVVFLILIYITAKLSRRKGKDFGLNFNEYKVSIVWTLIFTACWALIQFTAAYLMVKNGTQIHWDFPINTRNITGYFLFEVLLTGTSEELFFRGLIITILLLVIKRNNLKQRSSYIIIVLISAMIFMAGHINFELFPFRITYIDGMQQMTAFIFSCFYACLFLRTKSLLGPILAHNILNGIATICSMVYMS